MAADFDPEDPFQTGEANSQGGRAGFVPEFVRKMAVAGLGALFMTEEGIRSLAGQLKLPKEALTFILGQAEKTKDDLQRVISDEIRRFLQSEKLREEFLKLVAGMTLEVHAEVRLKPSHKAADTGAGTDSENAEGEENFPRVVTEFRARRSRKTKRE